MVLRRIVNIAVALTPWALVLFLHYWLEHGGIWQVDMAYRALISVVLLVVGMVSSFLLYSRLAHSAVTKKPGP